MVLKKYTRHRHFHRLCLIFSFLWVACDNGHEKKSPITIYWDKDRASGIVIPKRKLSDIPEDSIQQLLHIHLANNIAQPAILGEWTINNETVVFNPLIPLTRGLAYEVYLRNMLLGEVKVPQAEPADASTVLAVYPTIDTLPHNLLKIYIRFSKPMQEGQALQHITLIKNKTDTVHAVFLDLQPELWNNDRTILTLWLDPGRIKRDLQPNQAMGEPLQVAASYQLFIGQAWQDANGGHLAKSFRKEFVVTHRDSISPDPAQWTLNIPESGTRQPLQVNFYEPLDYMLLKHAVQVIDSKGKPVPGLLEVCSQETGLLFKPDSHWQSGTYELVLEARMEDLAGNNLNRLFDRDRNLIRSGEPKEIFERIFHIR